MNRLKSYIQFKPCFPYLKLENSPSWSGQQFFSIFSTRFLSCRVFGPYVMKGALSDVQTVPLVRGRCQPYNQRENILKLLLLSACSLNKKGPTQHRNSLQSFWANEWKTEGTMDRTSSSWEVPPQQSPISQEPPENGMLLRTVNSRLRNISYNNFDKKMSSKQGEFIYSTHLLGANYNLSSKADGKKSNTPKQGPKETPNGQVIQKERKESDHDWDHYLTGINQFGIRKMSEDENIDAFNPFSSLI